MIHPTRLVRLALLLVLAHGASACAQTPEIAQRCLDSKSGQGEASVSTKTRGFRPATAPRVFLALGQDRHAALKALLTAGENPNVCHAGMSPLMLAVASGDAEAVAMLLDAGASPDRPRDANGATVLHYALSAPQFALAELLLDRGADARLVDDGRKTTLHSLALQPSPPPAERARQIAIAGRLLQQKVPIDAVHIQGNTALGMAIAFGNAELMSYLLEQHANPSLPNKRGDDALAQARRLGNAALIERLERHLASLPPPHTK